ncbi:MAG TPA: hypothetical protein VKY85_17565 [Candidatus Angelobacter sp.]|nr:hypothetical protein [Candidatus Angelobacter sp.]
MTRSTFFWLLLVCSPLALASDCKQPLDADTLNRLQLGASDVQLRPGENHQFTLAILSTFGPAQEVPACVAWKIEPAGKGATMSSAGLLKIDPATPPGSKFVVTADIEHGRAQRQIAVLVYTYKTQPLVGLWKQKARSGCDGTQQTRLVQPINELEFRADGWFSVTWEPFETYRDYWGSYTAGNPGGALSLHLEQGNYLPGDFRGVGKYSLRKGGILELTGIYLGDKLAAGQAEPRKSPTECRYLFTRIP